LLEFKARQKKVDQAFNKTSLKQDSTETPSDSSDRDLETFGETVNAVTSDELNHDNDVFNNEVQSTGQPQLAGTKAQHDIVETDSLLAGGAGDDFAVDISRILNICDDMEVRVILPK